MSSLACGICCEGFDDEKRCPRLLNCGHSFCGGCLEKLIQAAVVTCPNCRKEVPVPGGVNGLVKNFALLDALLVAPKEDLVRSCNVCSDEHNAQFVCLDCKQNLCQQASLWHTKTKLTLKHRVVSFEELKANPQLLQTSNICPEHGKSYRYFDQDCGRVICRDCAALNHNGHKCSSLVSAAATYKEEIGAKVEQVVARATQVEAAEVRAAEVSRRLDENFEQVAADVRAAFQEIHDAATVKEAFLVGQLTQQHKAKSVILTNQRDLLHISRACLESVVQRTQNAINSEDDVKMLLARSDLTSTLAAMAAQPMAPETDDVVACNVDATPILIMLKNMGELAGAVPKGRYSIQQGPAGYCNRIDCWQRDCVHQ